MVGANAIAASTKLYDALLGALGVPPGSVGDKGRVFYVTRNGVFAITTPISGAPASAAHGALIASA